MSPWFHCQGCRDTFVKLEALSQRGSLLYPVGPSGPVTYSISTPSDLAKFMADIARDTAGGRRRRQPSAANNGRILPVLEILLEAGFGSFNISGFGDTMSECDGGRYALLLRQEGVPVAAATFNVFSPTLPAQVNMVAEGEPGRGHISTLFEVLGGVLGELKVGSVLLQPPVGAELMWAKQMGFAPMHPSGVAELHTRMPIAFLDAPVFELEL